MGALMRGHDWVKTPLGPPAGWPVALKVTLRTALATRHPMLIFWGDEHLCFYNDGFRASLGPEKHPLMLGTPARIAWADTWEVTTGPQIETVMRSGGATWHENQLVPITRYGELQDVYWTYSFGPIHDESAPGGIGGVLVLCTETTMQVLAEREKAAEARRLLSLFEQAPGFFCVLRGSDHVFDLVNAAYRTLIGGRDPTGLPVREALPEIEGQGYFELLDRVYRTGEPFVGRGQRVLLQPVSGAPVEEHFIDFIYQPIRDEDGSVAGILCEGSDVTDAVRSGVALRESEDRLRLIVEGARDYAILTIGPEGRIETWLPGAVAVFGWSEEEAVGQPAAMLFTPEDRVGAAPEHELETARREGVAPDVRWHLRKDGSRVFLEGRVTSLRGPNGQVCGFLKIGQDVTARKVAEERQALLSREVDHRAKNALAVVLAALQLTRAPDLAGYVRAITGRVAALARAQSLLADDRWAGADLGTLLRGELEGFLSAGGGDEPRATLAGPAVSLPAGAAQPLAMAVHELATNATKHGALSAQGGRIAITWLLEGGASGTLRLRWAETGGPPVAGPPTRRGFGSRVLDGTVRHQLSGEVSLTWDEGGLVCDVAVPLARIAGIPSGDLAATYTTWTSPLRSTHSVIKKT